MIFALSLVVTEGSSRSTTIASVGAGALVGRRQKEIDDGVGNRRAELLFDPSPLPVGIYLEEDGRAVRPLRQVDCPKAKTEGLDQPHKSALRSRWELRRSLAKRFVRRRPPIEDGCARDGDLGRKDALADDRHAQIGGL